MCTYTYTYDLAIKVVLVHEPEHKTFPKRLKKASPELRVALDGFQAWAEGTFCGCCNSANPGAFGPSSCEFVFGCARSEPEIVRLHWCLFLAA